MTQRKVKLNSWRNLILVAPLAGVLLCCSLLLGLSIKEMQENDLRLTRFANNFFEYPLPSDTVVQQRESNVGLLEGNGNHCDFLASQSVQTKMTADELEAYYAKTQFARAIPEVTNKSQFLIRPRVQILSRDSSTGITFARIQLIDIGYSESLDLRCH